MNVSLLNKRTCFLFVLSLLIFGCGERDRVPPGIVRNTLDIQKKTLVKLNHNVMDMHVTDDNILLATTVNNVYRIDVPSRNVLVRNTLPAHDLNYKSGMSQILADDEGIRFYDYYGVYNSEGTQIKDFSDLTGATTEMKDVDMDQDGRSEIIMGNNSIRIFDRNGRRIGRYPEGSPFFTIVDLNQDGRKEVLFTDFHNQERIAYLIDHRGEKVEVPSSFKDLVTHLDGPRMNFPPSGNGVMFIRQGKALRIIDPRTRKRKTNVDTEGPFSFQQAETVTFRSKSMLLSLLFKKNYQSWIAGVTHLDSELLLYDTDFQPVFHEVIPSSCTGSGVYANEGTQQLLLSCGHRIYMYSR